LDTRNVEGFQRLHNTELLKTEEVQIDDIKEEALNTEEVSKVESFHIEDKNEEVESEKEKRTVTPVLMKFVDETSQDDGAPESSQDKSGQISLEAMEDSQLSDDDSDEDIEAGLEKCFSALDKKLEEEKESESKISKASDDIEIREVDDTEGSERVSSPEIVEEPPEPVDFDKALGELELIEKKTKKILDDDSSISNKRSSDISEEPTAKKVRLDDEKSETEKIMKKKLKKELKKLTRVALEDMISTKMVEILTNKSEIGELRQQCDSFADTVEKWKKRAAALSKQCTDLSTVMRKYITDSKNRPNDKIAPVRITRSVGLQVMSPDQRRLQQHRQNLAQRQKQQQAASASTTPSQSRSSTPGTPSPAISPRPAPVRTPVTQTTPRQVGGTTISPSVNNTSVPAKSPSSVTITPAAKPVTTTTSKPVIDVVDLSDDEGSNSNPNNNKPVPPATTKVVNTITRPAVPNAGLRGSMHQARPRGGYVSYRGANRGGMMMQRGGMRAQHLRQHPAPLPPMPNPQPNSPNWKLLPPRPALKISRVASGIVLSWNMNLNLATHATIASYQLYAYQESAMQRPDPQLWKKVGDVKALPLPMACTLTQFTRGNKYHFAVRAMDMHSRVGQFSEPNSIVLN